MVSIDLDDVYNELSISDKDTLVEWLEEDGFTAEEAVEEDGERTTSPMNEDVVSACKKIGENYHNLSMFEEEFLLKLANRL